jgi:hypothetical protein
MEKVLPELTVIGPVLFATSIVLAVFVNYVSGPFKDVLVMIEDIASAVGYAWFIAYIMDKLDSKATETLAKDP